MRIDVRGVRGLALVWLLLALAACGGGGGSSSSPGFMVSTTVSGLNSGTSVVLQDNGGDNLPVSANGTISFHTTLSTGAAYAVTVATQPVGETCAVTNGNGTIQSANINVAITCTPNPFTVSVTVSGLQSGESVKVGNSTGNGFSDSLTVTSNGSFTFTKPILSGSYYDIVVGTQPTGETCSVANGSGAVAGQNVVLAVTCTPTPYTVSAVVAGLLPNSNLVIQNNGGDTRTITNGGTFNFFTKIANGSTYDVTVQTQPSGQNQTCTVINGSGTVAGLDVSVIVACPWETMYLDDGSEYLIDPITGNVTQIPPAGNISGPEWVTTTPNGKFVYFSQEQGYYAGYAINSATGALGAPVPSGNLQSTLNQQGSLLINPAGTFAYPDNGSNQIFAIDPNSGALTPTGTSSPGCGVFNPTGTLAYCTSQSTVMPYNGTITQYSVNSTTGAFTSVASFPMQSSSSAPSSIAMSPSGQFVYVWDYGVPALLVYSVDSNTGALAPASGSPYTPASGSFTSGATIAVHPSGKFVYVAGFGNGDGMLAFAVDQASGVLTPLSNMPKSTFGIVAVKVDPSGKFLYTLDGSGQALRGYAVDQSFGSLTAVPGNPFATAGHISLTITAAP